MKKDGYIALIGLGAIGAPLANQISEKYKDRFILLSGETIARELRKRTVYINSKPLKARIVTPSDKLDAPVSLLFVCVKNYSLKEAIEDISPFVSRETVILPLQNGVYSYKRFREVFPDNVILEGFAQGPNTRIFENNYIYQNPGEYHLGKNDDEFKPYAKKVYNLLKNADIPCFLDDEIRHSIWKKMMLNVAGNALTALTGLDYIQFKKSEVALNLCRSVMKEYAEVAKAENIAITNEDIQDVIDYYEGYSETKHTSMLEDVLNCRQTENEYLAGYIRGLADKHNIDIPYIDSAYSLVRIKEDVYLGNL